MFISRRQEKRYLGRYLCLLLLMSVSATQADPYFNSVETELILRQGPWPPESVPADAGNELSGVNWAEDLGQYLFSATSLSGNGKLSCASCHREELAFTDALSVAQGVSEHQRNTQGLLNVGLQRWFGWDGGADSQWSAAIRPMLSQVEMAGTRSGIASAIREDPTVRSALAASGAELPEDETGIVVFAAKAIASYTRTLISGRTAFDRYRDALESGDLTGQSQYPFAAKRGLKIFIGDANCQLCHFGPDFSNGEFHDTGRPFFTGVGQVDPGRYRGIERVRKDPFNLIGQHSDITDSLETLGTTQVKLSQSNWGEWRTPGLRELSSTAPYMHDGSLATLRQVVDAYADIDPDRLHSAGESLLKPLNLTERQREDLVFFLRTLSK